MRRRSSTSSHPIWRGWHPDASVVASPLGRSRPELPIQGTLQDGVLHTVATGVVTDEDLIQYYAWDRILKPTPPWRELVDGSGIEAMQVTFPGQRRLQDAVSAYDRFLKGGRVAMLAASDAVYGMFRMWELQRENLSYTVRVFRSRDEALAWLAAPPPPSE